MYACSMDVTFKCRDPTLHMLAMSNKFVTTEMCSRVGCYLGCLYLYTMRMLRFDQNLPGV